MAKEYKDTMKQLGDKLRSEPPKVPIQEVRPVESIAGAVPTQKTKPTKSEEAHFNFWADKSLMQRVKIHSAKTEKSIKEICIEALEQYLKG
jgi:hypothetical protein